MPASRSIYVSQFSDSSIPMERAISLCGPAAAIAFARANGRTPTLREAEMLAKEVGWTPDKGMAGPASEKALLAKMGVDAELTGGADEKRIVSEVQSGRPVIVSTGLHYFTLTDHDPQTGRFYVGPSGTALKNGKEWMSLAEIEQASTSRGYGGVNGALYLRGPVQQDQQRFLEANTDLPNTPKPEPTEATPFKHPATNDGGVTAAVRTAQKTDLERMNAEAERRAQAERDTSIGLDFLNQQLRQRTQPYTLPMLDFPQPPKLTLPSLDRIA